MAKFTKAPTDYENMTVTELSQLRRLWIEEAIKTGTLHYIKEITEEFGKDVRDEMPYPYDAKPAYRLMYAEISVMLYLREGEWVPALQDYAFRATLIIQDHCLINQPGLVCQYTFTNVDNDPEVDVNKQYFVPGSWLQTLEDLEPKLLKVHNTNDMLKLAAEKQELINQLLLHEEVYIE